MLKQSDSNYKINQRHSAFKSRADTLAQTISRSCLSTRFALQKLVGQAEGAKRKLEDVKRSVHGNENGDYLQEMMEKMQNAVEQGLAGLTKGAGKNKKSATRGRGGGGNK
jgi:hypothetical protein